jgi:NAD-dependent SIR2 family protein deacetylase
MNLYRAAVPHSGFGLLNELIADKPLGAFVFTSNVDGHFEKAGFDADRILEVHGSIHYLQCSVPCREDVWPAGELEIVIDESTFRADEPLPRCPHCGAMARPNILMFRDGQWLWKRMEEQEARLQPWLQALAGYSLAIVECGAGGAIPTVRNFSERMKEYGGTLIRINPRESQGPEGCISIAMGAAQALHEIAAAR